MNKLLENKVAVVTGSSKNLGLAIATALAVDGASVMVVSRSMERAREAVRKIEGQGGVAAPMEADVTEEAAADKIVEQAVARFGGVDTLVNCAGVFVWKPFLEISGEEWRQVLETNLSAPFVLTQRAAKQMIQQGRGGSIINISSIHGSVADPHVVPQCASKFGLEGLTRAAAEALRQFDIRVNAVAPGSLAPDSAERRGDSPRKQVTQADVATLVVYLASDLARSLTGVVLDAFGNTRTVIKA
jgi:NAD(P)-dependent dehydrogenase (short-subunit alcohol dehydrogenase family)